MSAYMQRQHFPEPDAPPDDPYQGINEAVGDLCLRLYRNREFILEALSEQSDALEKIADSYFAKASLEPVIEAIVEDYVSELVARELPRAPNPGDHWKAVQKVGRVWK